MPTEFFTNAESTNLTPENLFLKSPTLLFFRLWSLLKVENKILGPIFWHTFFHFIFPPAVYVLKPHSCIKATSPETSTHSQAFGIPPELA
jgi:hypothetical protein